MARQYTFAPGEYYHLYSRGTEKRLIFLDKFDYERFVQLLFFCNSSKSVNMSRIRKGLPLSDYLDKKGPKVVDIGAYCLMPNHFHLLVKANSDEGVSVFMRSLMTAYSMYFNTKNKRSGGLFESSYKSTHVADDNYLKYLFAYIHLNPVKLIEPKWREIGLQDVEGAKKYLAKYEFSSFSDYVGIDRDSNLTLSKNEFPEYFPTPAEFTSSVFDWIKGDVKG